MREALHMVSNDEAAEQIDIALINGPAKDGDTGPMLSFSCGLWRRRYGYEFRSI